MLGLLLAAAWWAPSTHVFRSLQCGVVVVLLFVVDGSRGLRDAFAMGDSNDASGSAKFPMPAWSGSKGVSTKKLELNVTTYVKNLLGESSEPANVTEIAFPVPRAKTFLKQGPKYRGSTFALVFRVHQPELPYLASFLHHYAKLGVTRFYAFTNFPWQHDAIAQFVMKLPLRNVVVSLASGGEDADADALLKALSIEFITEEYVINVDIDEFWVMPPNVTDLQELVTTRPGDVYFFSWLLVPNDHLNHTLQPPYMGLPGHTGKWMARVDALDKFAGLSIHTPNLYKGIDWKIWGWDGLDQVWKATTAAETGSLLHFAGRSFLDLLLKQLDQRGMSRPQGWRASDRALEANGTMPARFLTTAFLASQKGGRITVDPGHRLLTIDRDLEWQLTEEALFRMGPEHFQASQPTHFLNIVRMLHAGYQTTVEHLQRSLLPLLGERPLSRSGAHVEPTSWLCPLEDPHQNSSCPHYPEWSIGELGEWLTHASGCEIQEEWRTALAMLLRIDAD